jgi:hypothetical protein
LHKLTKYVHTCHTQQENLNLGSHSSFKCNYFTTIYAYDTLIYFSIPVWVICREEFYNDLSFKRLVSAINLTDTVIKIITITILVQSIKNGNIMTVNEIRTFGIVDSSTLIVKNCVPLKPVLEGREVCCTFNYPSCTDSQIESAVFIRLCCA